MRFVYSLVSNWRQREFLTFVYFATSEILRPKPYSSTLDSRPKISNRHWPSNTRDVTLLTLYIVNRHIGTIFSIRTRNVSMKLHQFRGKNANYIIGQRRKPRVGRSFSRDKIAGVSVESAAELAHDDFLKWCCEHFWTFSSPISNSLSFWYSLWKKKKIVAAANWKQILKQEL